MLLVKFPAHFYRTNTMKVFVKRVLAYMRKIKIFGIYFDIRAMNEQDIMIFSNGMTSDKFPLLERLDIIVEERNWELDGLSFSWLVKSISRVLVHLKELQFVCLANMKNIDSKTMDKEFGKLTSSLEKYGSQLTKLTLKIYRTNITDASFSIFCVFLRKKLPTLAKFALHVYECHNLTNKSIELLRTALTQLTATIPIVDVLICKCGNLNSFLFYVKVD